jgi:hypothetical protein
MAEGKPLRFIEWGAFGPCERAVMVGFVENPTGGGPATGKVQGLAPYECSPGVEWVDEGLPWSLEVTEPQPTVLTMRIGNGSKAPGAIFLTEHPSGVQHSGEVAAKLLSNGLGIGAIPGEYEFSGLFGGKAKIEGYAAQELIEIKHP